MAQYSYDEGGAMSSYFILTFLSLILIPLTISLVGSRTKTIDFGGCQCAPCVENRAKVKAAGKRSLAHPQVGAKYTRVVSVGWAAFAFFLYKVMTTKPNRLCGTPMKFWESRAYVSWSTFHPDKVKLAVNETMEMAQAHFIEITKAYKSLTDSQIRENWEKWGHPDGKQEFGMGLAIPPWIVEAKNNIWVLGVYGLVFGGGLPYLVGNWWFGSRQKTKDGVQNGTAEQFFKGVHEDSGAGVLFAQMAEAWQRESHAQPAPKLKADVNLLREKIDQGLGSQEWRAKIDGPVAERALVLIYAHLMRIPVKNATLAEEQRRLLLHTPTLLTSLLSMTMSHGWLGPTLTVLHLHALLAQAMLPDAEKLTVFAGVDKATADSANNDLKKLVEVLEKKKAPQAEVVRAAAQRWGKLEIAGAGYKVIAEKSVTPSAIMQLVFKLRIAPPLAKASDKPVAEKETAEEEDAIDQKFIAGKKDAEDLAPGVQRSGWAHAPFWPGNRKPSWWAVLADVRTGKVVVPPMRFTDIGLFPWRLLIFSDTYVGEDVGRDLPLRIEPVSQEAAEEVREDEISDPDEDTLAGQMAAMRGGKVKRREDGDSEEETSDTDGENAANSSSDSDSD
ncbi:hypothetical protein BKA62DRAFT_743479 [Auriculariales sp. MPI-PUGE-AT-0066]|nr:hypothetical protein BKA62DRAFT_743479 [Auriculariales sp. MPI-PUGE-AT-0066]